MLVDGKNIWSQNYNLRALRSAMPFYSSFEHQLLKKLFLRIVSGPATLALRGSGVRVRMGLEPMGLDYEAYREDPLTLSGGEKEGLLGESWPCSRCNYSGRAYSGNDPWGAVTFCN